MSKQDIYNITNILKRLTPKTKFVKNMGDSYSTGLCLVCLLKVLGKRTFCYWVAGFLVTNNNGIKNKIQFFYHMNWWWLTLNNDASRSLIDIINIPEWRWPVSHLFLLRQTLKETKNKKNIFTSILEGEYKIGTILIHT